MSKPLCVSLVGSFWLLWGSLLSAQTGSTPASTSDVDAITQAFLQEQQSLAQSRQSLLRHGATLHAP